MFRSLVKGFVFSVGMSASPWWAVSAMGGGLLSFETTPIGTVPADNQELSAPYAIPGGNVHFFFDVNGNNAFNAAVDLNPVFEKTGNDPRRGFASNFNSGEDRARPGFEDQLGTFFLREPSFPFGSFIALYDTTEPITELSGEIWDIDGVAADNTTEKWLVEVLNGSNQVVASMVSPEYGDFSLNSLDALPWTFQFRDLPPGVDKVKLTFAGTKVTGIGLGFNNFSPTVAVPEPSTFVLALAGCGALIGLRFARTRGAGART